MERYIVALLLIFLGFSGLSAGCAATPSNFSEPPLPSHDAEDNGESGLLLEAEENTTDATLPLGGKIAILANNVRHYYDSVRYEKFFIQNQLLEKYGEEQIQIIDWNQGYDQDELFDPTIEPHHYTDLMLELAVDTDIKAVIIHALPPNLPYMEHNGLTNIELTTEALAILRAERDDLFIACVASLQDSLYDTTGITAEADLVLHEDYTMMGVAMVEQAQRVGAKTFIYYCLDTLLEIPAISDQLEMLKQSSAASDLELIIRIIPGGNDVPAPGNVLNEDILSSIQQYGENTALFSPVCSFQVILLFRGSELRTIYPQPCHPSLYHSYVTGWGIDAPDPDVDFLLANPDYVTEKVKETATNNLEGHFGNWPVSCFSANMEVAVQYAARWMRGEVAKEGLEQDVLQQLMEDYSGGGVQMRPYEKDGSTYDNYQLYLLDYITY